MRSRCWRVAVLLTSCSGSPAAQEQKPPQLVPTSALNKLLLSADEVDAVMGTRSLTASSTDTTMADNRNLLPNLNCLGIWQVGESAIYGPGDGDNAWQGVRRQTLRTPDVDTWDTLAVQSVVFYPTAEAASDFFAQSADRWSKCTNHHVNITLNDQPLPKWLSGNLGTHQYPTCDADHQGEGAEVRACQHVLQRAANLIIDVEACKPQPAPVTAAAELGCQDRGEDPGLTWVRAAVPYPYGEACADGAQRANSRRPATGGAGALPGAGRRRDVRRADRRGRRGVASHVLSSLHLQARPAVRRL